MKKDRQKKIHPDRPVKRDGRFWLDAGGSIRRWLKLLAALIAILAASWAVPFLLTALFQALFAAWGIDGETVARAPGWAQGLYGGWLYVNGTLQGAAIALAAWLTGLALGERVRMGKGLWAGVLAGALAATALIALFRLLDVMRFGHALSSPAFSGLTPMLLIYVLAQALGAVLAAGLIGQVLSGWRRALGYAGCAALYALLFGRWTAFGILNSVLFGILLWQTHEKSGGVAPAFGFLAVFSVLTVAVLGMPPWQQGALYETYHVSKPWLSGGDMGPWAGLAMTAALAVLIAVSALPNRKR